jgi:murein L,D-transpeptidase YcbB/YkuD
MFGGDAHGWFGATMEWTRRVTAGAAICAVLATAVQAQPGYQPAPTPPPHHAALTGAVAVPGQTPYQPPQPTPLQSVSLRTDQIALLERTLAQADIHGFRPNEFYPSDLDSRLQSHRPDLQKSAQDQLIAETLRYAQAVHSGRLTANNFDSQWGLRPAPYDPTADFVQAVNADRLAAWLDSLPPPYPGYDSLRTALATYRQIAAAGGWDAIPDGPALKLGMTDPRVAVLRTRLAVEDASVVATGGPAYDAALQASVIKAQKRYGLNPDGVVHGATLAALNVPVEARIDQIIANMERWRWLPPTLPADRIQVNIAAAILTLFRSDQPYLSMKAVTGRPGDETPMLQSKIFSIIFNPPWNVPPSIASKELWPKERAHPGYLARNDFRVIAMEDGTVRLQQRAGPKAALGHVKFDFNNPYGVYLHDTPSHGTFGQYTRQVSHGCVRLERPVVLAKALLEGDPKWTPDVIDQTIAQGTTTIRTPIPEPIAVFLLYWTAFVGADGAANFRSDPYGWDNELMQRIAASANRSA